MRITAVGEHTVRIVTYRLGERYVCCIDDIDPGDAISRSVGVTAGMAESKALTLARSIFQFGHLNPFSFSPSYDCSVELHKILIGSGPSQNEYTVEQFLAVPFDVRMGLLLDHQVCYISVEGHVLPAGEGLRILQREARLRGSAA